MLNTYFWTATLYFTHRPSDSGRYSFPLISKFWVKFLQFGVFLLRPRFIYLTSSLLHRIPIILDIAVGATWEWRMSRRKSARIRSCQLINDSAQRMCRRFDDELKPCLTVKLWCNLRPLVAELFLKRHDQCMFFLWPVPFLQIGL